MNKDRELKKTNKMLALYIGSPTPHPIDYQMSCFDILFGEYSKYTKKELDKEHKRRLKLYETAWKDYWKNRKKELDTLEKLKKEV